MRVLVAAGFEAGSHWANTINSVKMAEGFARLGHEVAIICFASLDGGKKPVEELAKMYGLEKVVKWVQLPPKVMGKRVDVHWGFSSMALVVCMRFKPDFVFSRNYIFPYLTSKLGIPTVAESHAHAGNRTRPFLRVIRGAGNKNYRKLVTISRVLVEHYQKLGVPEDKLLVLPDAVDLHLFERPERLPENPYQNPGPHIVYAGHLYDYKGIPTIIEAAESLPEYEFHLVGGFPEDVKRHKGIVREKRLQNVYLHGLKQHSEMPPYLWHADVLLLPPSQYHPSAAWTSPVKLGEYLASGTPVVATSIMALREWLSEEEVEFVEPDDAKALAKGVKSVMDDKDKTKQRIRTGLKMARTLSYETRVRRILNACGYDQDRIG